MEHIVNNLDNIITLIQAVSESELTSFCYQEGEHSLSMEKKPAGDAAGRDASEEGTETGIPESGRKVSVQADAATTETQPERAAQDGGDTECVLSPMVGTFYSSKSEGGEPLVTVGDAVKAGQTVGIVEAMKLMNEIEAPCDGTVWQIMAGNGRMVEYGQPLIKIKRS